MTPAGISNTSKPYVAPTNKAQAQAQPKDVKEPAKTPEKDLVKTEKTGVKLTDEGKALLAALSEIDKEAKEAETSSVKSFAHGALGIDHPDAAEEKGDSSYSAGQYLKGAASVGALLLAIV